MMDAHDIGLPLDLDTRDLDVADGPASEAASAAGRPEPTRARRRSRPTGRQRPPAASQDTLDAYLASIRDIPLLSHEQACELAGDFLDQRSEEDLIYGAGLRLEIPGPIDAFAEYERIGDVFDTVAIGATWGF